MGADVSWVTAIISLFFKKSCPSQPCHSRSHNRRADKDDQGDKDKGNKNKNKNKNKDKGDNVTPSPSPNTTPSPPRNTAPVAVANLPPSTTTSATPLRGTVAPTYLEDSRYSAIFTGQVPGGLPSASGVQGSYIYTSSTGLGDTPPGSGPSTALSHRSSSGTQTTSLVLPTNSNQPVTSSSHAGAIAGGIIATLFVLFLVGFIIYRAARRRRRLRRLDHLSPSMTNRDMAGPRPLSWSHFFADRGSSYSATGEAISEGWGGQSHSGQTSLEAAGGHSTPTDDPFANLSVPNSEGHTSVVATRGHSENPFSDSGHEQ